ncbi:MAG: B12-binding domain-containing radical SAM protein [Magnetococcales bacterium]|nr:B12-binding domain-containing radical SAM protein [Magnetococcales bacterium]MBF0631991.1 B12-binding domain-containing radical SAM protein [Magnetococcales bacterium]
MANTLDSSSAAPFRVVLVCVGNEYLGIGHLSAALKAANFDVRAVVDESLFDDKNYVTIPFMARFFNQLDKVVAEIIALDPNLVGFSVITPTYRRCLEIAQNLKQRLDVPVIFGGVHPSALPERTLKNACVDMVCQGEGQEALVELALAMSTKQLRTDIANLWFKQNGNIIANPMRSQIRDINTLPIIDKTVFENQAPLDDYYLMLTSWGCPYSCNFCAVTFLGNVSMSLSAHKLRPQSVESAIAELEYYKAKYNFKWVQFLTNVFSADKKWTLDFLDAYEKRIGIPYKITTHVKKVDDEIAAALVRTGCDMVQIGIESFSEEVRRTYLNRFESNNDIRHCIASLDKYGLRYSFDYIFGLPGQNEQEIQEAMEFFLSCQHLVRLTPFWLSYFPKTPMVTVGLNHGMIHEADIEAMEEGEHTSCLTTGSITDKKLIRTIQNYRIFFRLFPILPRRLTKYLIRKRSYRFFYLMPVEFLVLIVDILVSLKLRDVAAISYLHSYYWHIRKRWKKR